jgi:pimeloyl-ACP methyl ester carboxylesterase
MSLRRVASGLLFCFAMGAAWAQDETKPAVPPIEKEMSRKEVTDIIADSRRIVSDNGLEEMYPIQINGTKQWISVRGRDRRNPILLFVHGGPGSPMMPESYEFQGPWEDYFTVVQWDQRGAGKTFLANDPKVVGPTISIDQMTSDTVEVIRFLEKHYDKQKVFLLGHSWGSTPGLHTAQEHPELLYAYIGVGQLLNTQKNEADGYRFALSEAKKHGNNGAVDELIAIAPYPEKLTFQSITTQRKWLMYYGGMTWGRKDYKSESHAEDLAPEYSETELNHIDDGTMLTISHLLGPLEALNDEGMTEFKCPLFVFDGRHDYATSHTLAYSWFQKARAPEKKFVWFENSAHMMMLEEPGRFLYHLVTDVRPIAARAGDVPPEDEQALAARQ